MFLFTILFTISAVCLLYFLGVKDAGKKGHCEYIRPPIDKYATMQFDKFDEIREVCKKNCYLFLK